MDPNNDHLTLPGDCERLQSEGDNCSFVDSGLLAGED